MARWGTVEELQGRRWQPVVPTCSTRHSRLPLSAQQVVAQAELGMIAPTSHAAGNTRCSHVFALRTCHFPTGGGPAGCAGHHCAHLRPPVHQALHQLLYPGAAHASVQHSQQLLAACHAEPARHASSALLRSPAGPAAWVVPHPPKCGRGHAVTAANPCPLLHPFAAQNINRQAQQQEAVSTIGGEEGGWRGLLSDLGELLAVLPCPFGCVLLLGGCPLAFFFASRISQASTVHCSSVSLLCVLAPLPQRTCLPLPWISPSASPPPSPLCYAPLPRWRCAGAGWCCRGTFATDH